jgi:ubiquinone/menaquinone biosynthesis C-methylase UbiE
MAEPKTNAVASRYDSAGEGYLRYWAPVLDASARALVDRVAATIDREIARARGEGRAARVLDIGTGAGVIAIELVRRWPGQVSVTALDASRGMLDVARRQLAAAGAPGRSVELVHAEAGLLPSADATFDVALSSFVLQLVPDRRAALSEAMRVLRPGGSLSFVTWLDEELPFEAADAFDDAVVDLEIVEDEDERDDEVVAGDFRSANAAAGELRRAGFRRVTARAETLEYAWTQESYLDYKRHYGETELFANLDAATGEALMRRARERMDALRRDAFRWRARIVYAAGRRP